MTSGTRAYAKKDDPKAIMYLEKGRDALSMQDYRNAMRFYKKCYKSRITKPLACLLLNQMANCMDKLEYYDQQQTFLEELIELELNLKNIKQMMKIYWATNNEPKRKALSEKIKRLIPKDDDEKKEVFTLLVQSEDHDEVVKRGLEWLNDHEDDIDIARNIINTYIKQKKIDEAYNYTVEWCEKGFKDKLYFDLANICKERYDFEGQCENTLKYLDIEKENVFGVNKLAYSFITSLSYTGVLTGDDYIHWMNRALEGTKPRENINQYFAVNTNFFRRIRVGFISYDFRMHSVGKFVLSLFNEIKNNTGIETYCYFTCPDYKDDITLLVEDRSDVFKYVGRFSDKQLRKELLDDKLDILVDLNGPTLGGKLSLLAERFAPVQVEWMGTPYSCFTYNIDYNLGDKFFDPEDGVTEQFMTEKALRMDTCYMCYAVIFDVPINPEPPQLRNGYITMGMVNGPNKFSAESIKVWQECLEAVPDSHLLIQTNRLSSEYEFTNVKERLERFGLDLDRVDFSRMPGQAEYYDIFNRCDVILDTFPLGGATTTADAIMMGVPVIGCQYPMRHGRMTYSFMASIGLEHLCSDSIESYPKKVRQVSQDIELLRELRENLRGRLRDTPLFNMKTFRESFENAMRDAFVSHCISDKKLFDTEYYLNDDGKLLKDCVRAADVIKREAEKDNFDLERFSLLADEYVSANLLLLERLFELNSQNTDELRILATTAEMIESLSQVENASVFAGVAKAIRGVLLKFA